MIEIDNITEARLLSNLKADFTASKLLRNELDQKIARWKSEYNAEPYGNEVNGRSKLVSRDIKKQSEWQHAALIEPFVSTPDIIKANPVTSEDAEIAPKIEVLLNTQFCRQFSRYNFMTKALKVLDQEGTVVIRTGWEYEEKIVEVEEDREIPNPDYQRAIEAVNQGITDPSILQGIEPTLITKVRVRKTKPVKNHPTAMVCRNEDIFIDPTCQDDMDKCQFVIYRYETDMTTLKQAGIYKNLDKIKIPTGLTGTNDTEYITEDSTSFRFSDTARKKIVVHEYWGNYDINGDDIAEPIVCTWIDNTIIRLEDNPFPDKKPPFLIVPFSAIPFKLYGESNAELLSDIQKIKTAIYRGFIDNMALSNNGQKGIKKGSLDEYNKQRFLNGENFEFNHYASDFFIGNFNELPSSIFNVLTLMNNEAESITGVASFNTGINGNALGSTATSIRGAIDSASTRRLNIVRNISENLVKPLLRKWLAYDAMFLDEESQYRITNDTFVYLKRDDLGANIDIDLSISTSDDNRAKAQELAFVLQTVGPSEDPRLRKILMAQIAQLYRMPDLAKMIMDYKPEPDPMAEQMQQLQMQLLQAEIANTQAKAGENTVDQDVKRAKVQTELAKAKSLNSMADKTDLDYVHQYSGIKEKEALQRQQLQNQFNIDRETLKLLQSPKQQYL
jgi:N4 gp59-like protein|nr:MAG TPA: Portal protein [Caudoviricetes sp.]